MWYNYAMFKNYSKICEYFYNAKQKYLNAETLTTRSQLDKDLSIFLTSYQIRKIIQNPNIRKTND